MARATASSLNVQRSSRLPPPRAMMMTSAPATRLASRQRRDDLAVGALALDPRRRDQDLRASPAPAGDLQDVADGRAGRAGDDHDPPREARQWPLAARVEQALGGQPSEPLAERQLERPDPLRLDLADRELVVTPRLVDGQAAQGAHGQAVGQLEGELARLAPPDHGADRRGVVPEREVDMPRFRPRDVRDLAVQRDLAESRPSATP